MPLKLLVAGSDVCLQWAMLLLLAGTLLKGQLLCLLSTAEKVLNLEAGSTESLLCIACSMPLCLLPGVESVCARTAGLRMKGSEKPESIGDA